MSHLLFYKYKIIVKRNQSRDYILWSRVHILWIIGILGKYKCSLDLPFYVKHLLNKWSQLMLFPREHKRVWVASMEFSEPWALSYGIQHLCCILGPVEWFWYHTQSQIFASASFSLISPPFKWLCAFFLLWP